MFPIYPIICIGSHKEPIFSRNPPIFPLNRTYSDIYISQCEATLL